MNPEPVKPDESECCGSGCNPCIFDVYEEQLRKWKMKEFPVQESVFLSESKFFPFLTENIEVVASNIRLFEFRPVKLFNEHKTDVILHDKVNGVDYEILICNLGLKAGHYLILKGQYEIVSEENEIAIHNISRSYTPIMNNVNQVLKIIVALYPDGKMSQFLNRLMVNDVVFWRGPYKEFTYRENSFKKLLLIGGGTGVIPLYNIARDIVQNDSEETVIKFLACFKNMDCLILRNELNNLLYYWNFTSHIYITNQTSKDVTLKHNETISFSKLSENPLIEELSFYEKDKCFIVICGPESFNQFICNTALKFGVVKENIYVFK